MPGISTVGVAKMVAQNIPQERIAALFGVTAARVSQIVAEPEFAQCLGEVRALLAADADADVGAQLDASYDNLELSLLRKLERSVTFLTKPEEISRILTRINTAKRRAGPLQPGANPAAGTAVTINMPAVAIGKLVVSKQNEVIEVDGRALRTMPSAGLQNLLEANRNEQTNAIERIDAAIAAAESIDCTAAIGAN